MLSLFSTQRLHYVIAMLLTVSQLSWASRCNFMVFSNDTVARRMANTTITAVANFMPNVRRLNTALDAANEKKSGYFFDAFLENLSIKPVVHPTDLQNIPKTGAAIFVCNHPYGFADGAALMSAIHRVRSDAKILMFDMVSVEGLEDHVIPVKLLGNKAERDAAKEKAKLIAKEWLDAGGVVVIFPAGRVASYLPGTRTVVEYPWHLGAARLALQTRATIVEAYVPGQNSAWFHRARRWNTLLGTTRLAAETVKLQGREIPVFFGKPIPIAELPPEAEEATRYLRQENERLQILSEHPERLN